MTQISYEQAVETTRKYFFALRRTSETSNSAKGVHEAGGFEAQVLTAIGVQRMQIDPESLIKDARKSVDAFDALRFAAANHISVGSSLPILVNRWVAGFLRGKQERPIGKDGKPTSEGMRREIYAAVIRLTEKGMKPTRSDASPPRSACDAVAEVLRELEMTPTTYGAIKKIYFDEKRGKAGDKYPAQFMISKGRVIDTD